MGGEAGSIPVRSCGQVPGAPVGKLGVVIRLMAGVQCRGGWAWVVNVSAMFADGDRTGAARSPRGHDVRGSGRPAPSCPE